MATPTSASAPNSSDTTSASSTTITLTTNHIFPPPCEAIVLFPAWGMAGYYKCGEPAVTVIEDRFGIERPVCPEHA